MSRQSVHQHFLFLREICSTHLLADPMTLGSRNIVVQIDESLFRHKPKYHHGRAVAGAQWVFGACDTSSTRPWRTWSWCWTNERQRSSHHTEDHPTRIDDPQRPVGCLQAAARRPQLHVRHRQPQPELC